MKYLRRVAGRTERTRNDLGIKPICEILEKKQIKWFGQVCRMSEEREPRNEPFSCTEILSTLKFHNEKRNEVALGKTKLSGAKNMWQLKWDQELADLAHKYAKKCEFTHNKARPPGTGENLAWRAQSSSASHISKTDPVGMLKLWYREIDNYDENGNSTGTVGHFTQMVWAETKFIGCGISYFEDRKGYPKTPYCTMLVCNYRPGGNLLGREMYIKHSGPDKCEIGVPSNVFQGLCAHDAEHAKAGDVCLSDSDSEGRILQESGILILINIVIAWFYTLREM